MLKTKMASGAHHFRPGTHVCVGVCQSVWEIHVTYTQATPASAIHLVEGGGWERWVWGGGGRRWWRRAGR